MVAAKGCLGHLANQRRRVDDCGNSLKDLLRPRAAQ
jgi:hypothetical protein